MIEDVEYTSDLKNKYYERFRYMIQYNHYLSVWSEKFHLVIEYFYKNAGIWVNFTMNHWKNWEYNKNYFKQISMSSPSLDDADRNYWEKRQHQTYITEKKSF